MIFNNSFRKFLVFVTLLILPMNLRMVAQTSLLFQDMDTDPTMLAPQSSNSSDAKTTSSNFGGGFDGLPSISTLLSFGGHQQSTNNLLMEAKKEDEQQDTQASGEEVKQEEQDEETSNDETQEQVEEKNSESITQREEVVTTKPISSSVTNSISPTINSNNNILSVKEDDDPQNTFAACLQIMDDNHFLIEWLAYHYHVMPLRRLIVFTDPNSRTSPQPILDRWKDRMDITWWDDEKYVYPKGAPPRHDEYVLFDHRQRQRQFVRRCLQKFHREGREWVLLSDTDEYAIINERVRTPGDPLAEAASNVELPQQEEPGSIMKFLQLKTTTNPHTNEHLWNIPCLTVARKTFGTNQEPSTLLDALAKTTDDFQTLRWKRYGRQPKPGKSIVNLRHFRYEDIGRNPSIHRQFPNDVCKGKMWLPEHLSVIVLNHYPGSLEQMLFRDGDARGKGQNATKYRMDRFQEYKKHKQFRETDRIGTWLPGFIKSVGGEEEAKRLLQYVGSPKEAGGSVAMASSSSSTGAALPASTTTIATTEVTMDMPSDDPPGPPDDGSDYGKSEYIMNEEQSDNPLVASIDDPNTFAGCLQIMDDNHFLIEWIAYHYHVMPLRRLIILTDPHSLTSPMSVLKRWQDRIQITLWNEDYVFPNGIPPPPSKKKNTTRVGEHRTRQRQFVRLCLQALHREGREWVVMTDNDEYTMINNKVRSPKSRLSPMKYAPEKNVTLPSQREPGSVMKFLALEDIIIPKTQQHLHDNPCITMARKTFGTRTMNASGQVAGYNISDFQTLNWRYYVDDGKPGKTIVNLRHVNYKDIPQYPSVHRPFTKEGICKGPTFMTESNSVLVANHYPGNVAQMLFRTHDARGNFTNATAYRIERFNKHKELDKYVESEIIQDWLPGFIESVGSEEAARLLEYVGNPQLAAGKINPPGTKMKRGAPEFHLGQENDWSDDADADAGGDDPDDEAILENIDFSQVASRDDANSFATCLIVNDSNHLLTEWIAYHYHVMPLRKLILFVDPRSQTSPQPILDRWKDEMDISVWEKETVLKSSTTVKGQSLQKTLERQFIKNCLQTLHKEGREWVFVTTVNEYIMINDRMRNRRDKLSPLSYGGQHQPIPSQAAPGSVLQVLGRDDVKIPVTGQTTLGNPCITMARKSFGNKLTDDDPRIVSGFDATEMQTTKWRYYSDDGRAGRSLVNLKLIGIDDILKNPSPNRPIGNEICKGSIRLNEGLSIFVVNRYTQGIGLQGKDVSISMEDHLEKRTIQAWLPGFIASVGEAKARELLQFGVQQEAASSAQT